MALPTYALLACDVFADEIVQLGGATPPWQQVAWLEMGLHDRPGHLRSALQAQVDAWAAVPELTHVVLAYGQCGNALHGLRGGRLTLVLPQAHDCIGILLGGVDAHLAVQRALPGAYFYSPGWIRGHRVPGPDRAVWLRSLYTARYGDDEELIADLIAADAETYAHQDSAAYVEISPNPVAEAYCQRCAAYQGWRYQRLSGDASLLQHLLHGPWDDPRIAVIPPGHQIARGSPPAVVQAQPRP